MTACSCTQLHASTCRVIDFKKRSLLSQVSRKVITLTTHGTLRRVSDQFYGPRRRYSFCPEDCERWFDTCVFRWVWSLHTPCTFSSEAFPEFMCTLGQVLVLAPEQWHHWIEVVWLLHAGRCAVFLQQPPHKSFHLPFSPQVCKDLPSRG